MFLTLYKTLVEAEQDQVSAMTSCLNKQAGEKLNPIDFIKSIFFTKNVLKLVLYANGKKKIECYYGVFV